MSKYEHALDYLRKYVCYDKSVDINPDNAVAWYGKGTALRKLGGMKRLLFVNDKSVDINPDNAVAWYGKSLGFAGLGEHKTAET